MSSTVTRRQKADAIRALAMDAVQRANSGHPGAPMGLADLAEVLWGDYLKHNPRNPAWCDRDRFVLSNGHASMLLYALLHLSGYDLSIDDIKNFRQLHSKTPGHPEFGDTPGIETTTGPLGQGLANAVGMAAAERTLAAQFNRGAHTIVDHFTYAIVGDGCLMEGISHEACSLAGALGLGKLIALYDANGISIDGEVSGWFADDTAQRFAAYRWHVVDAVDGHDSAAIAAAIAAARAETSRPSLIICRTVIGFGAPNKAGKASCHGAPLGEEEVAAARAELGWEHAPFVVPADIRSAWDASDTGAAAEQEWQARFDAYQSEHPELAAEFTRRINGELPADWAAHASGTVTDAQTAAADIATRKASQNALENFAPVLPELIGGSADLAESNCTVWSNSRNIRDDAAGNYIYFGVREFAMAAIANGIAAHRGFKPYAATFLVFSEYARNALRMAALMRLPSIFVFTHDSIGLGEDGPTHQPVEQLATLRLLPNLSVWRPCDAVETMVAWRLACESAATPFALALSRQALAHQARDAAQVQCIARGGYVLRDGGGDSDQGDGDGDNPPRHPRSPHPRHPRSLLSGGGGGDESGGDGGGDGAGDGAGAAPEAILIATGSEVALALAAAEALPHRRIRVVSMPSVDRFEAQDDAYRDSVLPPAVTARVTVEAGVTSPWVKYTGPRGITVGIDTFGASAPAKDVFEAFNLTVKHVTECVERVLADS